MLQHPELQAFMAWAKSKPGDFFVRTPKSTRIRMRRGWKFVGADAELSHLTTLR